MSSPVPTSSFVVAANAFPYGFHCRCGLWPTLELLGGASSDRLFEIRLAAADACWRCGRGDLAANVICHLGSLHDRRVRAKEEGNQAKEETENPVATSSRASSRNRLDAMAVGPVSGALARFGKAMWGAASGIKSRMEEQTKEKTPRRQSLGETQPVGGAAADSGTAWSLTSPTAGSPAWQRLGDAALQYATEDGLAKGITSIMKNCLAKLAVTFLADVESVNQALQVVQETNLHLDLATAVSMCNLPASSANEMTLQVFNSWTLCKDEPAPLSSLAQHFDLLRQRDVAYHDGMMLRDYARDVWHQFYRNPSKTSLPYISHCLGVHSPPNPALPLRTPHEYTRISPLAVSLLPRMCPWPAAGHYFSSPFAKAIAAVSSSRAAGKRKGWLPNNYHLLGFSEVSKATPSNAQSALITNCRDQCLPFAVYVR